MNYTRIGNTHKVVTEHGSFTALSKQKADDMASEAARRAMVRDRVEQQRLQLVRQQECRRL